MLVYLLEPTTAGNAALRQVDKRPVPQLGERDVLVKIRATSLNHRDLLVADRLVEPLAKDGIVPLSDAAGEVVEIGGKVSRFWPGDRVANTFFPDWFGCLPCSPVIQRTLGADSDGVLAEYVAFPETALVAIPDYLSFEEAACLPCAGVTAWHALMEGPSLRAGNSVALLGTGGVSTFALQLAKTIGVRVAVVSSSDQKLQAACHLGADHTINYRRVPCWDRALLDWTGGQGVDHIVEVGGANTLGRSINAVRAGGSISLVGSLAGVEGAVNPLPLLRKLIRLQGIHVGSRAMFESLLRAMQVNRIKPVISKVFSFAEAPAAYDYLRSALHVGKVAISL